MVEALAVVIERPRRVALRSLALASPAPSDVVVEVDWSGISTGTERLLWSGDMPEFPGMGYPLVPGYESVGRVVDAGPESGHQVGDCVFVPGAACFSNARSLFGGTASTLVVPGDRAVTVDESLQANALLLALAATAYHASEGAAPPDLIVGHGVLGRLLARITVASGADAPTVWEINADRRTGGEGYPVVDPADDSRRDYRSVYDVSGDANVIDALVGRIARGGEIVLAGFYAGRLGFDFAPAFMREARLRIAAEWQPQDLTAVKAMVDSGALSLDGLITHCRPAAEAEQAYRTAFEDPDCLKMTLAWKSH